MLQQGISCNENLFEDATGELRRCFGYSTAFNSIFINRLLRFPRDVTGKPETLIACAQFALTSTRTLEVLETSFDLQPTTILNHATEKLLKTSL